MIKQFFFMGLLLLANAVTSVAMATCGSPSISMTGANLKTVLTGNTLCQGSPGNWIAQESHLGNGGGDGSGIPTNLQDYKQGPGDPVDPQQIVGTWKLTTLSNSSCNTNCSRVRYVYGSNNYTFQVWKVSGGTGTAGSVYDFCIGTSVQATATLKLGTGAGCP